MDHMYVCMDVCVYACMYVYMSVCLSVCMYVCMCVCVCVCVCVYVFNSRSYIQDLLYIQEDYDISVFSYKERSLYRNTQN